MEEKIQVRASPAKVWALWEKAHDAGIRVGAAKTKQGVRYEILEVRPQESFSVLWKTYFVRLIFTHSLRVTAAGSEIRYRAEIKGLFAWFLRPVLGSRIRRNLAIVLQAIAKQV